MGFKVKLHHFEQPAHRRVARKSVECRDFCWISGPEVKLAFQRNWNSWKQWETVGSGQAWSCQNCPKKIRVIRFFKSTGHSWKRLGFLSLTPSWSSFHCSQTPLWFNSWHVLPKCSEQWYLYICSIFQPISYWVPGQPLWVLYVEFDHIWGKGIMWSSQHHKPSSWRFIARLFYPQVLLVKPHGSRTSMNHILQIHSNIQYPQYESTKNEQIQSKTSKNMNLGVVLNMNLSLSHTPKFPRNKN